MVVTLPISKTILTIADVENKFQLMPCTAPTFFREWQDDLPELTEIERATLDRLLVRFAGHRRRGILAEGAVDKLMISPLLDLVGFYEPEYEVRTEESVEFALESDEEVLRGRIDTLIVRDRIWILVIEAKRTIMASLALPQALSYMMCNPELELPSFGLITNGDEFIFVKAIAKPTPLYSASRLYSLFFPTGSQDLTEVFRVLKQIKMQTG
ncbi:type I restriction enzyme HsdR N-terminal domain-containing protein [Kamptonema sp. UHCC 0994]|uniref:type I restriction enzyme HsdR N-terminal domain-containing protein n=1 Tax=Kamptonema sp. UHCC 0994 TaxID=3031329 RepID=UPI0023B9E8CD|nr:type I restriction enzyme HsdR N-terminal domain-containing protein [Kamptonema sp. UHCC 0994]MDF0556014.1 type I restriction enzyme HsdR N-terminal domain-containing protein [Kamptonema sp. UHCC 0994]